MALYDWDNVLYGVGINRFDDDHKKLLGFINKLHEAMLSGKGKDVLDGIYQELMDYTKYHFSAEEQQMIQANYPHYAEHKAMHSSLITKLSELQEKLKSDNRKISIETFGFLKDWLFGHIQVQDKKYAPFLKNLE